MMCCDNCESEIIHEQLLWPRENLHDKTYKCMSCGHKWDIIVNFERREIYE
jgi:uncharacterized Zn finger protein